MSAALPLKADITERDYHVRFVPKADMLEAVVGGIIRVGGIIAAADHEE